MRYHLGNIFPESIVSENKKRKVACPNWEENKDISEGRIIFFIALLIFGLGFLLARLFILTVVEGGRYRKLAEENKVREVNIPAPRGIIYDRNNIALVRNIPAFIGGKGEIYFEEKPPSISGGVVETVAREYVFGDLFSHAVGFTGEISQEELDNGTWEVTSVTNAPNSYKLGDFVGKMGIEQSYDKFLRGVDGKELLEVDAAGNIVRVLGKVPPQPGNILTLSLDSSLQKIAKEKMDDKKGAVVATDPTTGEILALFSSPAFDPNVFIKGEDVSKIFSDERKPLFDRAISGLYPPGSTFKIITATAALEEGLLKADTKIEDTGILQVGNYSYGNWYFTQYGRKEGFLNIVEAFKRSNDIFFYKTGEIVGIDGLASWARKLGLGGKLGIDIEGEADGIMPDPEWLKKAKGENWYLGNTYHVAIGQGDILTTPLQVNAWTNVIASGGKFCRPQLAKMENGKRLPAQAGEKENYQCKDLKISKDTVDLIREGMKQACSPGGTGWPLFKFKVPASDAGGQSEKLKVDNVDFLEPTEASFSAKNLVEIPVACKTGTAEFADPKGRTHAWFTVFAPVVHPQISITVLVEGGGEGSSIAAPIAKEILTEWFGQK